MAGDREDDATTARRRWLVYLLAPLLLWAAVAGYGTFKLATWHCGRSVYAVIDARPMRTDLWLFDAAGHACDRLTSNGGSWRPLRSPNGRWVAYQSHVGFPGPATDSDGDTSALVSTHVIGSNGSGDRRLTDALSLPLRWSAEGSRLSYCRWQGWNPTGGIRGPVHVVPH